MSCRFGAYRILRCSGPSNFRLPFFRTETRFGRFADLRVIGPYRHFYPFEPRVMPDGSVLLNAFGCGFYRITDLDTNAPAIENVYTIRVADTVSLGACGIPFTQAISGS